MTIWTASVGEILELSADALICSASPQLNLSGGVGGEFLLRYGESMQHFLHDWLRRSASRFVTPGTVVAAPSCGSPFRVVLHAVAIDAFYDTSADVIAQAYNHAFAEASRTGCRTVASACLARGYGRATPEMFVAAIRPYLGSSIDGIDRVEFRSTNPEVIDAIRSVLTPTLGTSAHPEAGGRAGFEWEVVTAGQVMGAFTYSEVSVFVVRGQYWDVLHRLFRHEKDGRMWLGTAHSREPLADFGRLAEWTEFSDYIMEGGVIYAIRVREVTDGLELAVRLKGMNRDRYVAASLNSYIQWAGLQAVPAENAG